MSNALALQTAPLAQEVYALLRDMDASRFRRRFADRLRDRSAHLSARFQELSNQVSIEGSLLNHYERLASIMANNVPEAADDARRAWARYRDQLQQAYADFSQDLRAREVMVPSVRPTNAARSLVHVTCSVIIVLLLEAGFERHFQWLVPLIFATSFWAMEAGRHFNDRARKFLLWLFGPIAHPHEWHRVNSSTWLASGLVVLGFLFEPVHCAVGVAILGWADPMAGLVGRRWGKRHLRNGRSLEGSTTFFVVGTAVAMVVLSVFHTEISFGRAVAMASVAAFLAAIAELFSGRYVDDNLSIPLVAGTASWAVSHVALWL